MIKRLTVAICCCLFAATPNQSGSFAPGSGFDLTENEIAILEAAGKYVDLDGVRHYLIGDQLFTRGELSTKAFQGRAWTNGTVFFALHPDVAGNPTWAANFRNGCNQWSNVVPNVRCTPRVAEPHFVEVRTHTRPACVSYSETTGMKGGRQVLSIYHDLSNAGCSVRSHWNRLDVIAHEVGHVFGLVHEQNRWDRDSYVQILPQNFIDPSAGYQFRRIPGTKSTTYTPYDFESIMHYRQTDFAKPGTQTIVPAICFVGDVTVIGTRGVVTNDDRLEMQHHYGLPIYDMLRELRDPACGQVRVNPSEKKHFCDDLAENCGPGQNSVSHSAVTNDGTWWCPGSFSPRCPGGAGSHRSCCIPGKEPFAIYHRRGARRCDLGTRRRHVSSWSCGCPFYMVNARCSMASFGFNKLMVDQYKASQDGSLRTLGRFVSNLINLGDKGSLAAGSLDGLEDLLIRDHGLPFYYEGLDDARRKIQVMDHLGVISPSRPLTRARLHAIVTANQERRRGCTRPRCEDETGIGVESSSVRPVSGRRGGFHEQQPG